MNCINFVLESSSDLQESVGTVASKFQVATLLWVLCASHCFGVFVLQDGEECFQGGVRSVMIQGHISVAICLAVAVIVPIVAFLLERRGPEAKLQTGWGCCTSQQVRALRSSSHLELCFQGYFFLQQLRVSCSELCIAQVLRK